MGRDCGQRRHRTAVNDWIDDEGNPVHGDVSDDLQDVAEQDHEINERARKPAEDSGDGDESDKDA